MTNGKRIFISHSSKDKNFARMLANHLSEHGLTPWLDESELTLGDHLTRKITDALEGIEYMAIVLSPHSVGSKWVAKEIEIAGGQEENQGRKIIIPVLLKDAPLPPSLADRVYADFTDPTMYHKGFHEFLALLKHRPKFEGDLIVYSSSRRLGWENWSWDCECDENSTRFVRERQHCSISAQLRAFGGLAFAFRSGVSTRGYNKLQFVINGGDVGGQRLKLFVNDKLGNGIRKPVTLIPLSAKEWKPISISLNELDAQDIIFVKINFTDVSGKDTATFYLDDLRLTP